MVHATTLFTNALIERKGAKTAFITTEGFRDIIEQGYEKRFDHYDLMIDRPVPLVPRCSPTRDQPISVPASGSSGPGARAISPPTPPRRRPYRTGRS